MINKLLSWVALWVAARAWLQYLGVIEMPSSWQTVAGTGSPATRFEAEVLPESVLISEPMPTVSGCVIRSVLAWFAFQDI